MADPIDNFFRVEPPLLPAPVVESADKPMGEIEEKAITEDVALVRKELRDAIRQAAEKIPEILSLASQMQEPEMVDSASKFLTALSKLSTDLIAIDLRVLAESKKVSDRTPSPESDEAGKREGVVTRSTTADILTIINKNRVVPLKSEEYDNEPAVRAA